MELILHHLEKGLGDLCTLVVINAALLVNISDLEVEAPLAGSDFSNSFEQFIKIILAKTLALFEPFIVQSESLDNKLPQNMSGPDAELGGLAAVDPVADRDDNIQIKVLYLIGFTVGGSCCKFCNN